MEAISSFNTRGDVKCRIVPDSKKDRGTVTAQIEQETMRVT
ncbi:MAG: hypothetical protein ACLSHV_12635 [Hominisplanchenecus sp.]